LVKQVDLAHALLTPLTTIKGYVSSLLQSDAAGSPELQQEFLRAIDRAADQLNETIKGLLASLQYEPDSLGPSRTVATIPDLLKQAEAHLLNEKWRRLVKFHCYQSLPPVLVSQHHIIQVIRHLAHYADEAAAPGLDLCVEALYSNGRPLICIDVSSKESFTDRYGESLMESAEDSYRSQESALANGDLRLIVCRNILEAHGVILHAETSSEKAIRFWFTLPIA
jgi:K+-sensing histidine kinase KdpD